jgi:hypothetical protein
VAAIGSRGAYSIILGRSLEGRERRVVLPRGLADRSADHDLEDLVLAEADLSMGEREKTLCEVRRVLTPGGSLHMLDFMGTEASSHGPLAWYFHSSDRLKDNTEERILTLMDRAGFIS